MHYIQWPAEGDSSGCKQLWLYAFMVSVISLKDYIQDDDPVRNFDPIKVSRATSWFNQWVTSQWLRSSFTHNTWQKVASLWWTVLTKLTWASHCTLWWPQWLGVLPSAATSRLRPSANSCCPGRRCGSGCRRCADAAGRRFRAARSPEGRLGGRRPSAPPPEGQHRYHRSVVFLFLISGELNKFHYQEIKKGST